MKQMFLLLFFAVIAFVQINAQDTSKTIRSALDTKRYSFEPTSMTPMRGRTVQLTGGYFFSLKGDSLVLYLPYAGRAYSAPIGSSETGFDFTSTNFEYVVKENKKKGYEVSVKTKDRSPNSEFYLTVYDNGSATMRANNPDRQPISYNGYVKEKQ